MSNLQTHTTKLEHKLSLIVSNNNKINSHESNKRYANSAAALSYLLTNNSKNQTTRTIGQFGALGGLLYGGNQANKSLMLKQENLKYISDAIEDVCISSRSSFLCEVSKENKHLFLTKVLYLSNYLDTYVKNYCSEINMKNLFTTRNRETLMNLYSQEVFFLKLKLNSFLNNIDNAKFSDKFVNNYSNKINKINIQNLKKENNIVLTILITSIIIGFYQPLFFALALILYLIHTFVPFLRESKMLKLNSKYFTNEIIKTTSITSFNF